MGFVKLVVSSVLYPTAFLLLVVVGFSAYVHLFIGTEPSPAHAWNPNKSVHVEGLTFTSVKTNGVRLNVIEAGDRTALKLAVLLHGFPETALLSWHEQIPALVAAGFFVVAPDQRGYNQSEKPDGIEPYYIDYLADDIKGLIQHYNYSKAFVIGHDWGAAVAWWMAQRYPALVEKLVVINVPHTKAFKEHLKSSLSQLKKSWYVFYFQLPLLPEIKLASNDYSFLQGIPARSGIPGHTFSSDSQPRYMQAWSEPGALTGMINWYRATLRNARRGDGVDPTIRVPTHIIWGKNDVALDAELVEKSVAFCEPGMCQFTYLENATHWVQHDEPERVADILCAFLKA